VEKYGTATQATGDNIIRRKKKCKNIDTLRKYNNY